MIDFHGMPGVILCIISGIGIVGVMIVSAIQGIAAAINLYRCMPQDHRLTYYEHNKVRRMYIQFVLDILRIGRVIRAFANVVSSRGKNYALLVLGDIAIVAACGWGVAYFWTSAVQLIKYCVN